MKSRILHVDKRRSPGLRWGLGVLVVFAVASAVGYGYLNNVAVSPQVVLSPRTAVPQVMAYPPEKEQARMALGSAEVHIPSLTRSQRFDALVKASDPRSSFEAYKLARDCLFSRNYEARARAEPAFAEARRWSPPSESCQDLSPGQITARMQALGIAADAGFPGAPEAFAMEGPDGAGWGSSRDPALQSQWDERAKAQIEAGVKSGDAWSLSTAFMWYRPDGIEPDRPKALAFYSAVQEINALRKAPADPLAAIAIAQVSKDLTPEQLAAAKERTSQIVAQAKASPFWSNQ